MNNKETFTLISRHFPPHEAAKVLFALINSKINYHSPDIFTNDLAESQRISSVKRIEEPGNTNRQLRSI